MKINLTFTKFDLYLFFSADMVKGKGAKDRPRSSGKYLMNIFCTVSASCYHLVKDLKPQLLLFFMF